MLFSKFVPDDTWAAGRVAPLPVRWQRKLLSRWERQHKAGRFEANTLLRETTDKLLAVRIPLDASDATICDAAEAMALRCASAAQRIQKPHMPSAGVMISGSCS